MYFLKESAPLNLGLGWKSSWMSEEQQGIELQKYSWGKAGER